MNRPLIVTVILALFIHIPSGRKGEIFITHYQFHLQIFYVFFFFCKIE